MEKVVQILAKLVQALKHTKRFSYLSMLSYAQQGPQGTTTYMRRGTLLSVRGLQEESLTIEFERDTAPPFCTDLFALTVCLLTSPPPHHAASLRQAHWEVMAPLPATKLPKKAPLRIVDEERQAIAP